MYTKFLILFLLISFYGCSNGQKEKRVTVVKETAFLLLQADSTDQIGAPALIQTVERGFIIFDSATYKFILFDPQGNKLLSFGKKGKGPGEFLSLSGFKEFEDFYLVFDYRTAKFLKYRLNGEFIEDVGLNSDYFPILPVSIEALEPDRFIMPSFGKNGSLLMDIDRIKNKVQYFGNSVGDYVENLRPGESIKAITSRKIPAYMLNTVELSSNRTGIFSFQQTTALLEKYSYSRELIWKKKIETPALDRLFDIFFEKNIERINKGLPEKYPFIYARDLEANDKGVAILLNLMEKDPVTLYWVSNDGKDDKVVTFEGMKKQPYQFSISEHENKSYIFFTNFMEGTIYKAEWPL